ncbi:hypothetical protein DIRU0_E40426 [Diutina rugosa]
MFPKQQIETDVSVQSSEELSDTTTLLFDDHDANPVYLAKQKLVVEAIDSMGWGRYQWGIFIVAGFGWFADNAWPIVTSSMWPRLIEVDGAHPPKSFQGPFITLAQNLGLLAGAIVWSLSSDIIGRKWAFNFTFLFTGIFGLVAGSSPNFASVGVFAALWSFGVGGNLPVDSAIFLEAIPTSEQWLLTVMSAWWALGQVVTTLIAWGLISNFSCDPKEKECLKKDNWGWRYFAFTMGGLTLIMFVIRFLFPVYESAKYYVGKGDDAAAIASLDKIARFNRKMNPLTLAKLQEIDEMYGVEKNQTKSENQLVKERLKRFSLSHIRQCFGSKKLAWSTSLVVFTWGLIGLAFPLYNAFIPFYLQTKGASGDNLSVRETYRNNLIVAVLGVPGSIIGGFLTELRTGRKGVLVVSLLLTGVALFGSTSSTTSMIFFGWTCLFSFWSTMMYGVLYAYTPEVFYTQIRGTGVGLAASFNRVMGVFAPIIGMYADLTTSAPIYVSGALFLASGLLVLLFPYEPRGKSAL